MPSRRPALLLLLSLSCLNLAARPQTPAPSETPAPPSDRNLLAADLLIGKALYLRGFYAANDLTYKASGHLQTPSKVTDWTLSAISIQRAERRSPSQIQLDALRVAIRYNPDQHQFERHELKDEPIKLLLQDPGAPAAFDALINAIFSFGIDPALQRAMPDSWQHYFNPALPWPTDPLSSQTIYPLFGQPTQAKDVTPPAPTHRSGANFTPAAEHDRVHGALQLRVVIGTDGLAHRIAIARPLGYGLDERAVESLAKWRFTPAIRNGQPVPAEVIVSQDFEFITPPHR